MSKIKFNSFDPSPDQTMDCRLIRFNRPTIERNTDGGYVGSRKLSDADLDDLKRKTDEMWNRFLKKGQ